MRLCECWMPLVECAAREWGESHSSNHRNEGAPTAQAGAAAAALAVHQGNANHAVQATPAAAGRVEPTFMSFGDARPEAPPAGVAPRTAWYMAQLDAAALKARAMGFSDAMIGDAEFAVVAWLDECAMLSHGTDLAAWRRAPLQRLRFGTTLAGQQFFTRLDGLSEDAGAVREVYALMMLAGFRGEYTHRPNDAWTARRDALLVRARAECGASKTPASTALLPQLDAALRATRGRASGGTGRMARLLQPLRSVMLVLLPLAAVLAIYALGSASLSQQIDALIRAPSSLLHPVASKLPS